MNILKCNLLKDQSIGGQLQTDRQTGSLCINVNTLGLFCVQGQGMLAIC